VPQNGLVERKAAACYAPSWPQRNFLKEGFVSNVTKQDFIDRVASKSDLNKREAGKAVDAFIETVTESLRRGDSITFTGFGKFSTSDRAARTGVNPRTGERVQIAAARVPKFSAGSSLKQAVKSSGGGMGGGY
jgi:DNA-binding protein HU-beta